MASRIDLDMRREKDEREASGLRDPGLEPREPVTKMSKLFRKEKLGTGKGSWMLKRFRVRSWSEKC